MANVFRSTGRLFTALRRKTCVTNTVPAAHGSPLFTRTYTSGGIVYRTMKEDDKPLVRQFLYDHFFSRNPPCRILGMNPLTDCKATVDQLFSASSTPFSVVALDSAGHMAGISLQRKISLDDKKSPMSPLQTSSEKEKILDIFHSQFVGSALVSNVDIFRKYNVDVYLRMRCGTVHPKHSRKGVIKNIVLEVAKVGRNNGISCVVATAVNRLSMRALDKLGFECLVEKPIANFLYEGRPVFADSDEAVFLMGRVF